MADTRAANKYDEVKGGVISGRYGVSGRRNNSPVFSNTRGVRPTRNPIPQRRVADLNKGEIWTSDDFDEPLPDEFWMGTK